MAFILLKDEDGNSFLCNTSNIASIEPRDKDCVISLHRGTYVKQYADGARTRLQSHFYIAANGNDTLRDAIDLADEIALAERNAKTLDLRGRCPAAVKKDNYNPGAGW